MTSQLDQAHFCKWALGNINSNIKRAWLAEYLVNCALGIDSREHKQWGDYDVDFDGWKIEVKSSGHLTPPFPTTVFVKNPRFDIEKRSAYYCLKTEKRLLYAEPTRPADLYIFCLHAAGEEISYDPFDLSQWHLASVLTDRLDRDLKTAKSISWATASKLGMRSDFDGLRANVLEQLTDAKARMAT